MGVPPRLGVRQAIREGAPKRFVASGLRDLERALHDRRVRVTDEFVGALLERDHPRGRSRRTDTRLLVDAGPGEMEVVDVGKVLDDELVLAGLHARDLRAALLQRDREAGPVGA